MYFCDLEWLVSGIALHRNHMEFIDGSQRTQEVLRALIWMVMQELPRIVQGARSLAMTFNRSMVEGKAVGNAPERQERGL